MKNYLLQKIKFWNDYIMNLNGLRHLPVHKQCKTPCITMKIETQLRSKGVPEHPKKTHARVNLNFQKIVEKRFKVISYGFYDFLIDVGSSMGLWLGISVFSITHLCIQISKKNMQSCNGKLI